MAIRTRLTTAEEIAARAGSAPAPTKEGGGKPERSEEEKAARRERVEKAKKALADSQGLKGDHVVAARAALKAFLRNLNEPKQPNDEQFQAILDTPNIAPKKEKPGTFAFGGGGGGRGGPGGGRGAGGPGGGPRGPGGPGGGAPRGPSSGPRT